MYIRSMWSTTFTGSFDPGKLSSNNLNILFEWFNRVSSNLFFPALQVLAFSVVDDIKIVGLPNYSADQLINPHLCVCVCVCVPQCVHGRRSEERKPAVNLLPQGLRAVSSFPYLFWNQSLSEETRLQPQNKCVSTHVCVREQGGNQHS